MDYCDFGGLRISRLSLGTAQLGMRYGVGNRTGRPDLAQARRIIETARDGGLTVLDTARAYGDAEEVLGKLLAHGSLRNHFVVVSKFPPSEFPADPSKAGRRSVAATVEESCRRLGLEAIPIYLLHRVGHLDAGGGAIMRELLGLKARGLIGHLGVSVYTAEEALKAVEAEGIEVIQVPFNLFDQSARLSGFLAIAGHRQILVFGRSVYLQGLVTMALDEVPAHLAAIRPFKSQLSALAMTAGITAQEAALQFALGESGLASVLVGVETPTQLAENLAIAAGGPLDPALRAELETSFRNVPPDLVNPAKWQGLLSAGKGDR